MDWVSVDLVRVVFELLPGFVAAWVFYFLTAHSKPSPFTQVIQALVITVPVHIVTGIVRNGALSLSRFGSLGPWTEESSLLCNFVIALLLGAILAVCANNDWPLKFLRTLPWLQVTRKTTGASEWDSAFRNLGGWAVLHLDGGRRLKGWIDEWPDRATSGHLLIRAPKWLLDDGKETPLPQVEAMLVPADEVEMVQFLAAEVANKEAINGYGQDT